MSIALSVKNLSKSFYQKDGTVFKALDNISFDVKHGEVLGIIGKNGAGKSTLLNLISGISKPSSGSIEIDGKITSILDIGTGFHPDLTGRDNVYLNGNLNGLSNEFIDKNFNELLAFSELGSFIEQPVKNYSSGMYMRLAFSIFAFLTPSILLLDEVFSVGDVAFQNKCLMKIKELIKTGVTVLMVGHNMAEISKICKRVIIIDNGKCLLNASSMDAISYYLENLLLNNNFDKHEKIENFVDCSNLVGTDFSKLRSVSVRAKSMDLNDPINVDDIIQVQIEYEQFQNGSVELMLSVYSYDRSSVFSDSKAFRSNYRGLNDKPGVYIEEVEIPSNFLNHGMFFISIAMSRDFTFNLGSVEYEDILCFKVNLADWDKDNEWSKNINTPLRPKLKWSKKLN